MGQYVVFMFATILQEGRQMTDYLAAEGPAWLWILAVFALMAFGALTFALGWAALKWATRKRTDELIRTDMVREIAAHRERIEGLEHELCRVIDGMPADTRPTIESAA